MGGVPGRHGTNVLNLWDFEPLAAGFLPVNNENPGITASIEIIDGKEKPHP